MSSDVVMILVGVAISLLVLMQEGTKGGGLAALGGADSFLGKNQSRTRGAMLYRATRFCAILFFIVTIAVYGVSRLMA